MSLEDVGGDFDVDEHIVRVRSDLAAFAVNFELLGQGTGTVDGSPSAWFEYIETFGGADLVHREEATVLGGVLTTFSLISPVEFFESDVERAVAATSTYQAV